MAEGGQASVIKESDDDSSDDDDDEYSQSLTVTGSGQNAQKEKMEMLKRKYLNM